MGLFDFFRKKPKEKPYDPESTVIGNDPIGKSAIDNESGIVRFSYSYNGTIGGGSFNYTVEKKDDGFFFTYDGMDDNAYGELTTAVPDSIPKQLESLYKTFRIAEWNGFSKTDTDMLDGDGFSLSIRFADKNSLGAGGSNAFPERYHEFVKELRAILDPVRDRVKEEKRREVIAQGLHGKVDFILATFKQRGTSGRDEYHIIISKNGDRKNNFEVNTNTISGEFFPAGKYIKHVSVPDELLNFARVQEIIEKYDLIEWYDYDVTAKDYNNSEWFQLQLGFDDDFGISAMGTEPPKNYKKFRNDFLTWLKETADAVDAYEAKNE